MRIGQYSDLIVDSEPDSRSTGKNVDILARPPVALHPPLIFYRSQNFPMMMMIGEFAAALKRRGRPRKGPDPFSE